VEVRPVAVGDELFDRVEVQGLVAHGLYVLETRKRKKKKT
jgi:hypothetical protein